VPPFNSRFFMCFPFPLAIARADRGEGMERTPVRMG